MSIQSSYTKVYSVIHDSGSVLRRAIFSPRETSPEVVTKGSSTAARKPIISNVFQGRAFAVKVATKRILVFPFSGILKGCKRHKTHRFENDGTNQIRKTGRRFGTTFTANALQTWRKVSCLLLNRRYRGTSLIRTPPPLGPPYMALGIYASVGS